MGDGKRHQPLIYLEGENGVQKDAVLSFENFTTGGIDVYYGVEDQHTDVSPPLLMSLGISAPSVNVGDRINLEYDFADRGEFNWASVKYRETGKDTWDLSFTESQDLGHIRMSITTDFMPGVYELYTVGLADTNDNSVWYYENGTVHEVIGGSAYVADNHSYDFDLANFEIIA